MPNYRVLSGIDYAGKRAEPGTVVSDVPTRSAPWLMEQGIIEKIDGDKPKSTAKREPVSESRGDD